MDRNKNPYPGQALRQVDNWSNMYEMYREEHTENNIHKAHIATSEVRKHRGDDPIFLRDLEEYPEYTKPSWSGNAWYPGTHKPLFDIDMPVKIFPSTTEGHFHLFIDKELSWDDYCELMDVMAKVGILEQGYVNASKQRKYSAVRLPWIKKEELAKAKPDHRDEIF